MPTKSHPILLTLALAIAASLAIADPPASVAPITDINGVTVDPSAFKPRGWQDPHVIKSADDAKKVLPEADAKRLAKLVDFDKQFVLVFAWRGSGKDTLSYEVAESFPEQVFFRYQPGRTRDLRPHVHVFALRNNVTWTTANGR